MLFILLQTLVQMGLEWRTGLPKNVTHVFAVDANSLLQNLLKEPLICSKDMSFIDSFVVDQKKVTQILTIVLYLDKKYNHFLYKREC